MEDQIEQAVEIALRTDADPNLKQQAMAFCNEVKSSPDGWQLCCRLFSAGRKRSDGARFFCLQVIDEAILRSPSLLPDSLEYIKTSMYDYIVQQYGSDRSERDIIFMRNKLAQTITNIFVLTYNTTWPSFFSDILSLCQNDGAKYDCSQGVDMYLRIMLAIHDEIGDHLYFRSPEIVKRNGHIKDAIRQKDIVLLASSWIDILARWSDINQPDTEIVECALKVIGAYVSWIDISLIVTPQCMGIIFSLLGRPGIRNVACDTLAEIISKKMPSANKLELITLLNITDVIQQLDSRADLVFEEKIAHLCNVVTIELIKTLEDSTNTPTDSGNNVINDGDGSIESHLLRLMPHLLNFMANEYDDTSIQVFPAVSDYLTFLRKEKKRTGHISGPRRAILADILSTVMNKMKYDETTEWTGREDDSEAEFLDMRAKLKNFQDTIAAVDETLFSEGMTGLISRALDSNSNDWREIELGLYELFAYGEALRNLALLGNVAKGQPLVPATANLVELLIKMINSDLGSWRHPSIQLQFLELVVRHSTLFELKPELTTRVLEVFVSPFAIHNSNERVRARSWYLFYRFIKQTRKSINQSLIPTLLQSFSDLLVIKAEPPSDDNSSDASSSADAGFFDSQLYLFEAAGFLIGLFRSSSDSNNNINGEQGAGYPNAALQVPAIEQVFSVIYRDMEQNFESAKSDPQMALQIHHDVMALGTFARGFGDAAGSKNIPPVVTSEFGNASQAILVVLEALSNQVLIRDAARFSFARMVPVLGHNILPLVPRLIDSLLNQLTTSELVEFLGFLGQLIHNFKGESNLEDMLSNLLPPLMARIFGFLREPSEGSTDQELKQNEMKKSYFNFLLVIINNNMQGVLCRESNTEMLQEILQSILHYASDCSDPSIQRIAFTVLSRMVGIWGSDHNNPSPLPWFDQFILENVSRICWETLLRPDFESSDGQSRMVIAEIASLQKVIYEKKGDQFLMYLKDVYLPSINFPPQATEDYLKNLQGLATKDFKKFFQNFVRRNA